MNQNENVMYKKITKIIRGHKNHEHNRAEHNKGRNLRIHLLKESSFRLKLSSNLLLTSSILKNPQVCLSKTTSLLCQLR